eukprot:c13886_g1_i1 orf=520-1980(+)
MHAWKITLAAAPPAVALLLISISFIYYTCKARKKSRTQCNLKDQNNLCVGNCMCFKDETESVPRRSNRVANGWRTDYPTKRFDWRENPALISEAMDRGWSAFAFAYTCLASPMQSTLWNMCTICCHSQQNQPELMWELCGGSVSMQKIRLNPGNDVGVVQSLQATLPLPGPPSDPPSFPSEGYFEITILTDDREYAGDSPQNSFTENEHVNLISRQSSSGICLSSDINLGFTNEALGKRLDLAAHAVDKGVKAKTIDHFKSSEMIQIGDKELQATHNLPSTQRLGILAIGLAPGRAPPFRLPGRDAGSVGFGSDGHVYLNGALHIEQDLKPCISKQAWGCLNTTVGCGFNPTTKYIYFTLNGDLVSELRATSGEFGTPLFPTIAGNYDVTLLANFGQNRFEYLPANSQRILDPCQRQLLSSSGKTGAVNEDSGDLFSMGRIDAQWLSHLESPTSQDIQQLQVVAEPESELFEIVLDTQAVEFINGK